MRISITVDVPDDTRNLPVEKAVKAVLAAHFMQITERVIPSDARSELACEFVAREPRVSVTAS